MSTRRILYLDAISHFSGLCARFSKRNHRLNSLPCAFLCPLSLLSTPLFNVSYPNNHEMLFLSFCDLEYI
jgi:hypothetical protein